MHHYPTLLSFFCFFLPLAQSCCPSLSFFCFCPLRFHSHSPLLSMSLLPLIVTISVSRSHSHPFSPSAFPLSFSMCYFSVSLLLSLSSAFLCSSSVYLLLTDRQCSLAAASFCSLFAANGSLACCVQGNKSHQAGTQVLGLPLHVGQSGQFSMVW